MRTRLLVLALGAACVALLFAVLGMHSTASASGSGDPRIAALQTQVKALQAQTKALRTQITGLDKTILHVDGQVQLSFLGTTCLAAETADLLQGTWSVIDQIKPTFGPQTQVNDYGNCGQLDNVPRTGITVPPSTSTLAPLIKWLHE